MTLRSEGKPMQDLEVQKAAMQFRRLFDMQASYYGYSKRSQAPG